MEREWSRLPERFNYLRPAAEEYADWLMRHNYHDKQAIDSLSSDQIARLAKVYEEIDGRGEAEAISEWLHNYPDALKAGSREIYWPVFGLFAVFRRLAKRGVQPFASKRVRFWVPDPPMDWSKLPQRLQYLAEAAEKYGDHRFEDNVDEFLEEFGEEGMNELAALSERVKMQGDAPAIYKWLEQYDWAEHEEANRIAWMLNLMEDAGVPIED